MTPKVEERTEVPPAPRASAQEDPVGRAKKRAEEIQGLYIHLLVFLVINAGLFVIHLLTRGTAVAGGSCGQRRSGPSRC